MFAFSQLAHAGNRWSQRFFLSLQRLQADTLRKVEADETPVPPPLGEAALCCGYACACCKCAWGADEVVEACSSCDSSRARLRPLPLLRAVIETCSHEGTSRISRVGSLGIDLLILLLKLKLYSLPALALCFSGGSTLGGESATGVV